VGERKAVGAPYFRGVLDTQMSCENLERSGACIVFSDHDMALDFVDLTGELLDNDECFFDDDNDNEYNRVVWFSPAAIPAITAELRCFELDE
jgi:hypothetical protein